MPLVAVVMGSKSDTEAMQPTLDVLTQLGIDYEVSVISATVIQKRLGNMDWLPGIGGLR